VGPEQCHTTLLLLQIGLSLAAFAMTLKSAGAICATPLMQHSSLHELFGGVAWAVEAVVLLLLPTAPLAAGAAPVSCRRGVVFLQLAVGVVAPTACYLWDEVVAAAPFAALLAAAVEQEEQQQVGWELRFFVWLNAVRVSVRVCCWQGLSAEHPLPTCCSL